MMDFTEFMRILLAAMGAGMIYFVKRLVDKLDEIAKEVAHINILMAKHDQRSEDNERRIDELESKVEKLESNK